ncbi:MAG: hypothetical protein ACRELC_11430, partial [Gemmatimonadota bacterium]
MKDKREAESTSARSGSGSETREPGSDAREPGSDTREPGSDTREPGSDTREPGSELAARPATGRAGLPATTVTRSQLERVIRRASDLQFRAGSEVGGALEADEVLRIGEEVGLDSRWVRQALAEVQADALMPAAPEDAGAGRKIVGSSIVRASRVVPGDASEVESRLSGHLSDRELLKPVRSRPGRSLWEPAGGVVSTMRRAMDVSGHGYQLAKARNLQVAVEGLESGWSLVTLTADLRNLRNQAAGGFFTGFLTAATGASIALLIVMPGALPILGATALGAAALGGATWAARSDLRRRRERIELALQG